jgi:hypothetical protein
MGVCLGLACAIDAGRPVVRAVQAVDAELTELFRYAARRDDDWPLQLRTLQMAVDTELKHRDLDCVVVRQMDYDSRRRVTSEVARRIAADGVVTAAARSECELVLVLTGREVADACGSSKDEVLATAGGLVSAGFREAGAAALAALRVRARDT